MKSIIQENTDTCFACGRYGQMERHHAIFGTANKKKSDKYGLTVYLCADCHRGTAGVHGRDGYSLDLQIKRIAQKKFEEKHGHKKFMEVFGRNYIDN